MKNTIFTLLQDLAALRTFASYQKDI